MAGYVNCFELRDGKIIEGIPKHSRAVIENVLPFKGFESDTKERYFCAKPVNGELVPCLQSEVHPFMNSFWILYFEVPDISFAGDAFLSELTFRPGAECKGNDAFWSSGFEGDESQEKFRKKVNRAEIWVVQHAQVLFLCDTEKRLRVLRMRYGKFEFSEVDPLYLANYLLSRGAQSTEHRTALWVLSNTEVLAKHFPRIPFDHYLERAQFREKLFRYKVKK